MSKVPLLKLEIDTPTASNDSVPHSTELLQISNLHLSEPPPPIPIQQNERSPSSFQRPQPDSPRPFNQHRPSGPPRGRGRGDFNHWQRPDNRGQDPSYLPQQFRPRSDRPLYRPRGSGYPRGGQARPEFQQQQPRAQEDGNRGIRGRYQQPRAFEDQRRERRSPSGGIDQCGTGRWDKSNSLVKTSPP